jgi:uncharacterized protein (TIGR02231 family)
MSAELRSVTAPIVEVTVLEDRAQIRRRAMVPVAGSTRLVIDGVAPALVDKSLLVTAGGGARVVSATCERYLAPWVEDRPGGSVGGALAVELEAERKQLVRRIVDDERAAVLAESEAAAVLELTKAALAELSDAAAWGDPDAGAGERLAVLDARERAARQRAAVLAGQLGERRQELARLDRRIVDVRDRVGREAARVVIDLAATAAADVELAIEYVVPGAAWRPYHRARLEPATGALVLRTDACVWQSTGEDWTAATLIFSTERPSLGVEPPDLYDDVLAVRRRPDQVVVETRDQDVDSVGLGRGAQPQEVPGIDDGGLGTRLRGAAPATIAANGRPYRVLLVERTMTAAVELVAMPERGLAAHLRAVATNPGPSPILAGPVDLVLATGYVGRGVLGFIASGEKIELGFGPDAEIRMHREPERTSEEGGLLSGWNQTRVRIAVRISNLGDAAKRIEVTERVPISEVEQVKVEIGAPDAWTLEDDDGRREAITVITARTVDDKGMMTWVVELPPRERRAIALEYRIRSQKGVLGV